ncbi:MAG: hypothetical protein KY455_09130 [Euryarchaeota archaeon]|nr:hypothetical protein [Euryarchaeota archaeon]
MAAISHGWFFVALELLIVIGLVWGDRRWRERLAARGVTPTWRIPITETLVMAVIYAFFRIQPWLRGGDVFAFVLGVFDGVAIVTPILFFSLHLAWRASAIRE